MLLIDCGKAVKNISRCDFSFIFPSSDIPWSFLVLPVYPHWKLASVWAFNLSSCPQLLHVPSYYPCLQSQTTATDRNSHPHASELTSFQVALPWGQFQVENNLHNERDAIPRYSCLPSKDGRRSKVIPLCLGWSFLSTGQDYIKVAIISVRQLT